MRARRFRSRFVSSGLLLAAYTVAAGNVFAQEVQVTTASAKKAALAEAIYLDLPTTILAQETSPSDLSLSKGKDDEKPSNSGADKSGNNDSAKTDASSRKAGEADVKKDKERDSLAPLQNRELSNRVQVTSIGAGKVGTGLLPTPSRSRNTTEGLLPTGDSRGMYHTHVYWNASLIQHNPLYFEDAMLERHGHTRNYLGYDYAQSVVSGVKFFATIPLLPYHMTLRSKHQCVYALGHYRAGSGAPCLRDNIPYDAKAAIVESSAAAAFFWAIPL